METTLPAGFRREADGRLRPPPLFGEASLEPEFWEHGFVRTPALDAEALGRMIAAYDSLAPFDGFDPRTIDGAPCTYHCTFLDRDHGYRRQADELVREALSSTLASLLPGYRILTSNIYVKPPGVGRFEIHQNWPTIGDLEVPTLTVWVPLQDTSFRNGTIRIVRGGHRLFPDVAAASSDRFFDDFETELIESYLEPVDVAAGEALIFDDSLLHWSGPNVTDRPRVTFQIEMVPVDLQAVLWIRAEDDPTQFDLWAIDKEYWIEYPFESVLGTPEGLPYVGRRPNPNRRISFEEFQATMGRADKIRRSRYVLD